MTSRPTPPARADHVGAHDERVARGHSGPTGLRRALPLLWVVLCTSLAVNAVSGPAASARSEAPTWKDVAKTLSDEVQPSSANPCNRGEQLCVEIVLAEMLRRMGPLAATCSHHAPFGATYAIVTQQFSNGWPFTLRDPSYIGHLDALFARDYFAAYDRWKRGAKGVAPAWQVAFDAAKAKSVTGLGDMLLGMNAHISNDLPFVLERIGLTSADGTDAYDDYTLANQVLADVQNVAIDAVAQEFDPAVADVSVPALFVGREGFVALIGTWRAEAWARAQQLLSATTPAERKAVADDIRAAANTRALLIRAATSYAPGLTSTTARDEHCRAQHP